MVGVPGVERGRQCDKWQGLWSLLKAGRQPIRFDKRVGDHTGPRLRLRLTQHVPPPEIAAKCVHGNRNAGAKETEQARFRWREVPLEARAGPCPTGLCHVVPVSSGVHGYPQGVPW